MACARDVKARKIDAVRVFDAPIFRARGRGSLLEDPKSQSLHWAMLKRLRWITTSAQITRSHPAI